MSSPSSLSAAASASEGMGLATMERQRMHALAMVEAQRMRELSLEDPARTPCLDTAQVLDRKNASCSCSSSLEEIWHKIQHHSPFPPSLHAASTLSGTLTMSRDRDRDRDRDIAPSSSLPPSPSSFVHLQKDKGSLRRPLTRARQHLNSFDLVKTLEFLIEEAPASAPEIQHYQEALGVQQRKRQILKRQKMGHAGLLRQIHRGGRGSKMCHYKAIVAEAAAEQVKKELDAGVFSYSDR